MTFKIILSGITGRIGVEVLQQSLRDPSISSVIALSRRALPDLGTHAKLEVVVLKDFTQYPKEVISKLSGADACIWCMTTTAGDPVLELEYPKAFGTAIAPTLKSHNKRFRYLHLTGAMVERDQNKTLWTKSAMRKTKGQGEVQMIEFENSPMTDGFWETIIARPGMVMRRGTVLGDTATMISGQFIKSDELALALIDAVLNGVDQQLLQQPDLLKRGGHLVEKHFAAQKQAT